MIEAKCFRFGMLSSCFRHVFFPRSLRFCAMQITWRQWVDRSSRFNLRLIELHGDGVFVRRYTDSAIIKVDFKSNNWAVFVCHARHQMAVPVVPSTAPHSLAIRNDLLEQKRCDRKTNKMRLACTAPRYIPCACEQSNGGGCGGGDAGIFFWLLLLTDFHQYFRYFFHVNFVLCAQCAHVSVETRIRVHV